MAPAGRNRPVLEVDAAFVLDAWRADDGPAHRALAIDPAAARAFGWTVDEAAAKPAEHYEAVVRRFAEDWSQGSRFSLAIRARPSGDAVGAVELRPEAGSGKRASVSYVVRSDLRGRGLAPRALERLLEWGRSELGLETIELVCHVDNRASARVAQKCGFTRVDDRARNEELRFRRPLVRRPRLAIIGSSGNGKTTLARRLAERLGVPHVELDALCHLPNWQEASDEDFRAAVLAAMASPGWVLDGTYERKLGDLVCEGADTVVWLDLPLPLVLRRLIGRALRDIVTQRDLFNGNRQSWRMAFFERDSLVSHAIRQHFRRRREVPRTFAAMPDVKLIRLRSPREVERWLAAASRQAP